MSWSFVNAGARAVGNNSSSLSVGLPTGWAKSNLLVIVAYARGSGTTNPRSPSLPSGWSEAARYDGGYTYGHIAIFYKIATSSEVDVTVTFSGSGVNGSSEIATMLAFSGNDGDQTNVLGDVGADSFWLFSGQNIGPISAITLTYPNELLLVCAARQNDMGVNGNSAAVNVLSGDGQTWYDALETGTTLGTDAGMVIDYCFTTGTPSITAKTFTNTDSQTAAGCGMMVAFKEATSGSRKSMVRTASYSPRFHDF